MNTNEFTGFRPISSSKKEDPKDTLTGAATSPSYEVIAKNTDYITQLAEQEGIHSCLPTSLLNGLIHLGVLTHEEGLSFQDSFRDRNNHFFSQRAFGERTLTVLSVSTATVLETLKKQPVKGFTYKVVGINGLSVPEVEQLFEEQLSQEKVIVAGDENHAVLVIGYNKESDTFSIKDPYSPKHEAQKKKSEFAGEILRGEPWITVLETS